MYLQISRHASLIGGITRGLDNYNQSINQSINQPVNQSIKSTNQFSFIHN